MVAHSLSALVARKLSAFGGPSRRPDEAGGVAAGDEDDEVRGGVRRMDGETADAGGGGAASGGVRPHVPALRGPLRGGRAGRPGRQAAGAGVGAAGAGGRGAAPGGAVPGGLQGLVGGALPRALPGAPRRGALVHVGEVAAAGRRSGGEGQGARHAAPAPRAGAAAGDAGAPGRLDAPVGAGRGVGPDRDDGRRDVGGVLGLPRRGGGHVVEPARGARDGSGAGAVLQPVHGPRVALLAHAEGGRQGGQGQPDAVRGGRWGSWGSR